MNDLKAKDRVERTTFSNNTGGVAVNTGDTGTIDRMDGKDAFVIWDGKKTPQFNMGGYLKKVPTQEFKQLKEITGHAISKHITDCAEMRNGFNRYNSRYEYFTPIAFFKYFIDYAKTQKGWLAFLIKHGFIARVKPEVFYRTGDRFYLCGREFMLYADRHTIVALTSLHDGFRYGQSLKCKNTQRITMQEFSTIVSPESPERFVHSSKYAVAGGGGVGGNNSGTVDVVGWGGSAS